MLTMEVYADGSGNTFDSDGGYGYRVVVGEAVYAEGSGYLSKATNNTAEITSAIYGLEKAKLLLENDLELRKSVSRVVLVSDSQLVLGYASGRYRCRAPHLLQLYIRLRKLYESLNCNTRWVKGHSGNVHNEACDKLAKAARLSKNST